MRWCHNIRVFSLPDLQIYISSDLLWLVDIELSVLWLVDTELSAILLADTELSALLLVENRFVVGAIEKSGGRVDIKF